MQKGCIVQKLRGSSISYRSLIYTSPTRAQTSGQKAEHRTQLFAAMGEDAAVGIIKNGDVTFQDIAYQFSYGNPVVAKSMLYKLYVHQLEVEGERKGNA